jgi:hypothetical protein
VRTVLRWIEAGRVAAAQHPAHPGRRLVEIASLDRAVQAKPEPLKKTAASLEHEVDFEAVLAAVRGLYRQRELVAAGIGIGEQEVPEEELLACPFASGLWTLVNAVRGNDVSPPEMIEQAITKVLRSLYTDPITGRVLVPDAFWRSTLIGRHVARAKLLLYPASDLVSLRQVAGSVGLHRDRVENILEAIGSERMFDPDEGRWLYPRDVIAAVQSWDASKPMQRPAADIAEDQQDRQSRADPAPVDFPSAENRRLLRAVRDAYHRRYFPSPGQ